MPVKKRNSYIATQFETREEQESGDLILSGYFIRFMKKLSCGQAILK